MSISTHAPMPKRLPSLESYLPAFVASATPLNVSAVQLRVSLLPPKMFSARPPSDVISDATPPTTPIAALDAAPAAEVATAAASPAMPYFFNARTRMSTSTSAPAPMPT